MPDTADSKDTDAKPQTDAAAPDAKQDAKQDAAPQPRGGGMKVLALLIGVVIVAFAVGIGGYEYFEQRNENQTAGQGDGAPQIGGPFTLVDHDGNTVTDETYRGRYIMVFFGFTYCPDICPTALSDTAAALDMLGADKASKVTPLFISVDPARDTPEHLKEYVSYFHPNTIGLTGSEAQIKEAARVYRAYYRLGEPSADDPLDYLVDHTAIIYVMGPNGEFLTHFSNGTSAEEMAERLGRLL